MDKEDESEDNNLTDYFDSGPCQFYKGPTVDANYTC